MSLRRVQQRCVMVVPGPWSQAASTPPPPPPRLLFPRKGEEPSVVCSELWGLVRSLHCDHPTESLPSLSSPRQTASVHSQHGSSFPLGCAGPLLAVISCLGRLGTASALDGGLPCQYPARRDRRGCDRRRQELQSWSEDFWDLFDNAFWRASRTDPDSRNCLETFFSASSQTIWTFAFARSKSLVLSFFSVTLDPLTVWPDKFFAVLGSLVRVRPRGNGKTIEELLNPFGHLSRSA